MIDLQGVSNAFIDVLDSTGETITVNFPEGSIYPNTDFKIGMIPATKAAYNMIDREYLFTGQMNLNKNIPFEFLRGVYFDRAIMPNNKYILLSVILNPVGPTELATVYAVQCNEQITIQKLETVYDEVIQENVQKWVDIFTDVYAFFNTVVRSEKETQDGSFDQAIYTLTIPARYKVSPNFRIIKNSFVDGNLSKIAYKVQSIDTSLVDVGLNEEINGVLFCQLSKDINI